MADAIGRETDGEFSIDVFPESRLGPDPKMFADLRAGKIPNDGDRMAQSTLMGIMGRMSAYTGKEVTWEMALNSKLDTMPKDLAWDMKLPVGPVPEPGVTPLI